MDNRSVSNLITKKLIDYQGKNFYKFQKNILL